MIHSPGPPTCSRYAAAAAAAVMALLLTAGCTAGALVAQPAPTTSDVSADSPDAPEAVVPEPVELPGGGRQLFPGRRLVALYGHPGSPGLGALGEQGPDAAIDRVRHLAAQYQEFSDVPVVPTFELIATVAHQAPGPDGDYSGEASVEMLRPWVEKAQQAGVYVLLDLQPGRARFVEQAKIYAELLEFPNVGLALDPEWKLEPGQYPLQRVGSVDAVEVEEVKALLDGIVTAGDLPQKLLLLHQFQLQMVRGLERVELSQPGVQVLVHMDGQGGPAAKEETWAAVRDALPLGTPLGWKNFYDEDTPMFTPAETMLRQPQPLMVSYQ
ncbi:hypothetical protein E5720_08755 [Rhodococcus sp. PAMC28707]|uniref:hypothetical protein n=1 Tax=unclassified Rhodococcus (in: high G+C Gram-positive bacteria) TaxID=192944 RepID=UPI00109E1FC1|nr:MULTISPECIES: hypothetical protein [unclassified Rhodococcus (in: high G+C Gram-positive bacteria)]QCB49722.1 hypothetical protein E5769_05260 [Rhodococcus sp. PAMC28705]QCB58586.1 hypothetical protein E5720_08755 [Rhodococcus sp. PAMC28707]